MDSDDRLAREVVKRAAKQANVTSVDYIEVYQTERSRPNSVNVKRSVRY